MSEQLIFLLIAAAVALGKWFLENAGSRSEEENLPAAPRRQRPQSPGGPGRQETEEEKMRRFMEALGLPSDNPPPPARPAPPQPKPPMAQPPSPAPRQAGRMPARPNEPYESHEPAARRPRPMEPARRRDLFRPAPEPLSAPAPAPRSVRETAPAMEVMSLPPVSFRAPEQAIETAATGAASSATLLKPARPGGAVSKAVLQDQMRDPAALRRAILLKEILGAPKGLQSAASPSIFSPL